MGLYSEGDQEQGKGLHQDSGMIKLHFRKMKSQALQLPSPGSVPFNSQFLTSNSTIYLGHQYQVEVQSIKSGSLWVCTSQCNNPSANKTETLLLQFSSYFLKHVIMCVHVCVSVHIHICIHNFQHNPHFTEVKTETMIK